jgi:hypothetical protein
MDLQFKRIIKFIEQIHKEIEIDRHKQEKFEKFLEILKL